MSLGRMWLAGNHSVTKDYDLNVVSAFYLLLLSIKHAGFLTLFLVAYIMCYEMWLQLPDDTKTIVSSLKYTCALGRYIYMYICVLSI